MRKSIVLFVLASLAATLSVGCMPNAEGPLAYSPRSLGSSPSIVFSDTASATAAVSGSK